MPGPASHLSSLPNLKLSILHKYQPAFVVEVVVTSVSLLLLLQSDAPVSVPLPLVLATARRCLGHKQQHVQPAHANHADAYTHCRAIRRGALAIQVAHENLRSHSIVGPCSGCFDCSHKLGILSYQMEELTIDSCPLLRGNMPKHSRKLGRVPCKSLAYQFLDAGGHVHTNPTQAWQVKALKPCIVAPVQNHKTAQHTSQPCAEDTIE